jgi:hypothetical protein
MLQQKIYNRTVQCIRFLLPIPVGYPSNGDYEYR